MKNYKEINAETFDNSRLPLKCIFKDEEDDEWYPTLRDLVGIIKNLRGGFEFQDSNGHHWDCCAEPAEYHPRKVPKGVLPLPCDKPFLAYVPWEMLPEGRKCVYTIVGDLGWVPARNKVADSGNRHGAIDVSTEWASKIFPDIVKSMGYDPIFNAYGILVSHKINDDVYDLEWKKLSHTQHVPPPMYKWKYETFHDYKKSVDQWNGELAFNAARELESK